MNHVHITTPEWLDEDFLLKVLRENKNYSEVKILQYEVNPAGAPGENYISDIYRVRIETNVGERLSLIVKCLPTAEFNLKFIRNAKLFEKEINVYESILPSVGRVEKNSGHLDFAPRCFSTHFHSAIVLEDLSPLGFKAADRRRGLDLEHCGAALKSLASFHAFSLGLSAKQLTADFQDTVYSGLGKDHASSYVNFSVLSVADRVEKWPGYEKYAEKLRQIASSSCDRVIELFSTDFPFRVLNHGDYWTNNILFLHTPEGKVASVKMIDFQMCRYVSPVFDLLYFLYTSPEEDVRLKNQEILLEEYCKEFTVTAKRLGLNVCLTMDVLNRAMKENAFFGFINAIMMLPAVLSGPEEPPDLANVAEGRSGMGWLSGDRFRHQFQNILKEFEANGYF